jgi:The ARF-like 2 binding protein BART
LTATCASRYRLFERLQSILQEACSPLPRHSRGENRGALSRLSGTVPGTRHHLVKPIKQIYAAGTASFRQHKCHSSVLIWTLLLYCTMQEYLALFEGTLEEFIEREGATLEEFYAAIRDNQDSRDPGIKLFVTCLLASADYDSFFKVMVKVSCAALAAVYSCTITHVHCALWLHHHGLDFQPKLSRSLLQTDTQCFYRCGCVSGLIRVCRH